MNRSVGLFVMALGGAAVVIGLLVYSGAFGWFGRLPGDIRIENENTRIFIPLTSMVLVSVVGSILLALFRRFF